MKQFIAIMGGLASDSMRIISERRNTGSRRGSLFGRQSAYGAALDVGVTTRIHFGAFYVLCALCLLTGDILYGVLLLGAYGAARALTLFPASWGLRRHRCDATEWLSSPLFDLGRAQRIVAAVLMALGAHLIVSSTLEASVKFSRQCL